MDKELFETNVIFKGHVQGVGFRFITCNIARKYDVSGWVKNLYDGSVQVEARGTKKELNMFISDVRKTFSRNIDDFMEEFIPVDSKGKRFTIMY